MAPVHSESKESPWLSIAALVILQGFIPGLLSLSFPEGLFIYRYIHQRANGGPITCHVLWPSWRPRQEQWRQEDADVTAKHEGDAHVRGGHEHPESTPALAGCFVTGSFPD